MVLLVASLISVFIAILIVFYNASNLLLPANIYLSLFFLIFGIYGIAQYVIQFSSSIILIVIFFNHFTPLFACFGPLLYLYAKKVINDDHVYLRKEELIHLLPFTIALIDLSPYIVSSFESKVFIIKELTSNAINYKLVKHLFLSDINATILRQFVNFIYVVGCFMILIKVEIKNTASKKQNNIIVNWLRLLFSIMTLFLLVILLETLFNKFALLTIINVEMKLGFIYISWLFRFILIISIFFFPTILYGLPNLKIERRYIKPQNALKEGYLELDLAGNDEMGINSVIENDKKGYKVFTLDNEYLKYIDQLLNEYMLGKPYLNEKFGLSCLTIDTKIPMHHLHIYFKEFLKKNFNTWKNEYKINYSKQLIENNMLSNLTTEAIALNSGFKSYSNYFTLFKSLTRKTPTEYASSLKNSAK